MRVPSPSLRIPGPRARRTFGWAAAAWAAGIAVLSHLPYPPDPGPVFPLKDKLAHGILYAVLGALAAPAASGRIRRPVALVLFAAAVGIGYGMIDEFHQSFIPQRSVEIADLLADLLGGLAGGIVAVSWMQPKRNPEKAE